MSFLNSLNISASGMTAQRLRMDVVSENIANMETTRTADGEPYRRKMVVLRERQANNFGAVLEQARSRANGGVEVSEIAEDTSELIPVYDPGHPDADEDGYVRMPNVDLMKETADAMAAYRAYEANVTAFNTMKAMAQKALEVGR